MIAANLNGLFAPAGVPRTIIDRIAEATRKIMAEEEIQKILVKSGFEPILDSGPEATRKLIIDESARWVPIMKASGFKLD
jgi:tripartite-type tricarboxylate transporter receptor subunit TctC